MSQFSLGLGTAWAPSVTRAQSTAREVVAVAIANGAVGAGTSTRLHVPRNVIDAAVPATAQARVQDRKTPAFCFFFPETGGWVVRVLRSVAKLRVCSLAIRVVELAILSGRRTGIPSIHLFKSTGLARALANEALLLGEYLKGRPIP